ncbi:anti-sigma factor [Pseudomonas corrugata]|uniref:Anti-sigma factor n=1 Tax=Pseudomonas corrugata TaxID=47879 RepID=A0A7Y5Z0P4_9PSED|nr:cupin domain-containing protein [Pseudomonas corrugata]NUT84888.1 anti-sigma factor [Pseudomonas corrugata]
MLVNADFSLPATVASRDYQWVASPQSGVERVMLDRLGGEKARATSIVRYAPQSIFPPHPHPGGEEILVLSGTFSEGDEHHPAGTYLRNPPGSAHQPFSREGAIIFVKLWQMKPDEQDPVRIDTSDPLAWQQQDSREICPLFSAKDEQVCLLRLRPEDPLFTQGIDSAEVLVLSGQIETAGQSFERGSWMRLPPGAYPDITAGNQGATVYLKTGHLLDMPTEA